MSSSTANYNFYKPDISDVLTPLAPILAAMQDSADSALYTVLTGILNKQPKGVLYSSNLSAATANSSTDVTIGTNTVPANWAVGQRLLQIKVWGLIQGSVVGNVARVEANSNAITAPSSLPVIWQPNPVAGAGGREFVQTIYDVIADASTAFIANVLIRLNSGTGTVNFNPGYWQITDLGGV